MSHIHVHGPDAITLEGRTGACYLAQRPGELTGNPAVDAALFRFPVAVFLPPGREPAHTPVVIGLQGLATPFQETGFLVPTLLDMGIACVLFDIPLAGQRSLIPDQPGDVVQQIIPLARHGISFTARTVAGLMDVVARDFVLVLDLVRRRHGLRDDRLALFGISMGCLLSAHAFTRDGRGARLLGVIGHADLHLFARSYAPSLTPLLVSPPARVAGKLLSLIRGPYPEAALRFLGVLQELRRGGEDCVRANPMTYAGRVSGDRRVRFLVGEEDPRLRPKDAQVCSLHFPDGKCHVVPGMAHGTVTSGPSFADHVRTFVATQLADWRW